MLVPVDCGILDIKNGSLVTHSTFVGSRGTVRCDELFQFFGDSNTADCQSSGTWAGLSGNCLQVEWKPQVLLIFIFIFLLLLLLAQQAKYYSLSTKCLSVPA